MTKNKTIRRKAIDCKLVKESNTYQGYFKYIVTIQEADGSISKHPTYGKDMQDAMKRLVRSEHADKVVEVVEKKQHFILLILFALCVLIPLFGGIYNTENRDWWMVLPLVTIIIVFVIFEILERNRLRK